MIWWSVALFFTGLALSAFFSGSETGFYRIPRVRLLIDALAGDFLARSLLWLTNHPTLFVATTLIGNNVANYLTSLAIVMAAAHLFAGGGLVVELLAPIALAPVVFVFGELLPKNVFFYMPNRLLRGCGPLFLCFAILFLPASTLLWGLSKLLEWLAGESPQKLQARLARKELKRVLEEGHEAGILRPSQKALAQGIFALANRTVTDFATPTAKLARVGQNAGRDEVLRVARQNELSAVPVAAVDDELKLVGYVRVSDLLLGDVFDSSQVRPLLEIDARSSYLPALMTMQSAEERLARVVDASGATVGVVSSEQLSEPLFRGGETRDSLADEFVAADV